MSKMANPDIILHSGRVYPHAKSKLRVEAVAVWNGKITDVGKTRDVLKYKARSVELVDLKGRTLLPGFCDSHIHLLSYGLMMRQVQLYEAQSIKEIQDLVRKAAKGKSASDWIVGRGWDQEKLEESRYPDKRDLDTVTQNPVYLRRVCGHIGVLNSAALASAEITASTPEPEAGEIVRDPATGEPTGLLKEKALQLVEEKVQYDDKTVHDALVSASRKLSRLGLTSLHCIIGNSQELRVLRRLGNEGRIKQSIYAIIPYAFLDEASKMGFGTEVGDARFRLGGVKIFMDGSLGARTAALNEPYSDLPSTMGMMTLNAEELNGAIELAERSGFQLCIHAIGDRAVGTIVKAMEDASDPAVRKKLRHRIEHCSIAPNPLLSRIRRLGMVASVQPRFIYSDGWAIDRVGKARESSIYPFGSMTRKGIPIAAGSDGPVEDPSPIEGVWSAVARPNPPKREQLPVADALRAYTLGGAYASHCETSVGTIEVGKRADMVVLDRDPFETSPQGLRDIRVEMTMINGEIVFEA